MKNLTTGIGFLHCWKKALSISKTRGTFQSLVPDLTEILPILPTDHVLHVFQDLASFLQLAINVIQTSDDVIVVKGNGAKLIELRNDLFQPIFEVRQFRV